MIVHLVFRDVLSCGHHVNVERVVPGTLAQVRPQRLGSTSRCYSCPPHAGGVPLVVIDDVWVQIAPGSYVDVDEVLHLDAIEVCELAGVEPTAENQERLCEVARAEFADRPTEVAVELDQAPEAPGALARQDAVKAIADLCARAGARDFTIGYLRDEHEPEFERMGPGWYAQMTVAGSRVICDEQRLPEHAADGLAHRLLNGGVCTHCGQRTVTRDVEGTAYDRWGKARKARCVWWRDGDAWHAGCGGS